MKVVFISPEFKNYVMSVEHSSEDILEAIEFYMKQRNDLSYQSFLHLYGSYNVYTVIERNLNYQGTVEQFLSSW